MAIISMNHIEKSFSLTEVLKDFSLTISKGEKVGLIGANGSGKTTVLKIISGLEHINSGNLNIRSGIKIGYLEQMTGFKQDHSIYEELQNVFAELIMMKKEMEYLEKKISELGNNIDKKGNENKLNELMQTYSEIRHNFEAKGGYEYNSQIKKIATGMGFALEDMEKQISVLSGGEKTRLGLVKLLLTKPDLLLLDEPTNHLDLSAIQWLEGYLHEYDGSVIIISHDRYFLDQVVSRIVELKNGHNEEYAGNYSYYLEERKRRYEQRKREYENQQKKIEQMEASIKRLEQWGRQGDNEKFFKRARSMQKALDKIERVDKPVLDGRKMKLNLTSGKRSGREVLMIENLAKAFVNNQILKNLDFSLFWEEKSAIIGKNGTGKTTLIKLVIGDLKPDAGKIKIGASVKPGYYSQEFEGFNPEDDLVTALRRECDMTTAEARNVLAAFLFTEDEVFKKVKNLSGGEKSRLRLLQLMNGDYNFLILDEPTNHLDLPSREILEETLSEYTGSIMVVSHDRYFLNKFIDYTYELENGSLTKYYGNYNYYRKKKEELLNNIDTSGDKDNRVEKKSDYHRLKAELKKQRQLENMINDLESRIEELETRKKQIEEEMIKPENIDDFNLLQELKEEYDKIEDSLIDMYQEWEYYV